MKKSFNVIFALPLILASGIVHADEDVEKRVCQLIREQQKQELARLIDRYKDYAAVLHSEVLPHLQRGAQQFMDTYNQNAEWKDAVSDYMRDSQELSDRKMLDQRTGLSSYELNTFEKVIHSNTRNRLEGITKALGQALHLSRGEFDRPGSLRIFSKKDYGPLAIDLKGIKLSVDIEIYSPERQEHVAEVEVNLVTGEFKVIDNVSSKMAHLNSIESLPEQCRKYFTMTLAEEAANNRQQSDKAPQVEKNDDKKVGVRLPNGEVR